MREREHRRRFQKIVPLLIFAAVGLFIAKQEIPAVDSWISRMLDAEAWNAGEACRKAALAAMQRPEYARLLDAGDVEKTGAGFYVGGVEVANLQPTGEDRRFRFSCNVTPAGKVVALSRHEERGR